MTRMDNDAFGYEYDTVGLYGIINGPCYTLSYEGEPLGYYDDYGDTIYQEYGSEGPASVDVRCNGVIHTLPCERAGEVLNQIVSQWERVDPESKEWVEGDRPMLIRKNVPMNTYKFWVVRVDDV